jgi:hypothetical protein
VCFGPLRVSIETGCSTLYLSLFLKKYPELRTGDTRITLWKSRSYACAEKAMFELLSYQHFLS